MLGITYPHQGHPPEFQDMTAVMELLLHDVELQGATLTMLEEWDYENGVFDGQKPNDSLIALWAIASEINELLSPTVGEILDLEEFDAMLSEIGTGIKHDRGWEVARLLADAATKWWLDERIEVNQALAKGLNLNDDNAART